MANTKQKQQQHNWYIRNQAELKKRALIIYNKDKERILKKQKERRDGLSDDAKNRVATQKRQWRENNLQKVTRLSCIRHRRERKEMADGYIRQLLYKHSTLTAKDIPVELIKIKRMQLKLFRLLEEHKNG